MLNILVPLGGKSVFFESNEYPFPKPLIEIGGVPMIQRVLDCLHGIAEKKRFLFVVNESDCHKYHLDNVLNLLTENRAIILRLTGENKGAACSALMAIEHIDNEDTLVISNGDQVIEEDLNRALSFFGERKADAGVITFESVHPKWSYVRVGEAGRVIETAEKRPVSKHAIAGFYYFRRGRDFVKAAMRSIEKDASVNGAYFIAPCLNEMVLENKRIEMFPIEDRQYKSFYSPQKIKEYEKELERK